MYFLSWQQFFPTMRIFKWILLSLLLVVICWFAYRWYSSNDFSVEAFSLVPADAVYCITTKDPASAWNNISSSVVWSHLQKNERFASLTESANSLDSLIRDNRLLFEVLGSRSLLISAHMVADRKHDFLFLVDLQGVSGAKFLNEYLTNFSTAGYKVSTERHGDVPIIEIRNVENQKSLFCSVPGSYLLASYNKQIITSALDARQGRSLFSEQIILEDEKIGGDGTLHFYVNYSQLPHFTESFTGTSSDYVNRLSEAIHHSVLSMKVEDHMIRAAGNTFINDSVESYIKTLSVSGKAPTEFLEIAPQRTGFLVGLGFNSFSEFFSNFEKNIQANVTEYASYREALRQVENYLKIDLTKNFTDWVGDEIALLELQSSGKGLDNETALLLKADNIERAKKELAHIEKMVRRKTPVKFKTMDHHGYAINYLSMKGLFSVVLGKFFARYDKPYYTIVNNFVIFSNHPQTLQSIIDDYLARKTLDRSDEFRTFRKEFEDEGSVFVYLNTPVLFNTMKKLTSSETRSTMEKNKDYIVCFRHIGFQLIPSGGGFRTILTEQFEAPETSPATLLAAATAPVDTAKRSPIQEEENDIEKDPMALPYIYVSDPGAHSHTGHFPDGIVQFKVDLTNGFKDGDYVEYYPNGEVKMKGHFRNDKRNGTWRLFDESGDILLKRSYEDGRITKEKSSD